MQLHSSQALNVMLFPQTNCDGAVWVAQCVDFDFAAQGETMAKAQSNFSKTIAAHIAICLKNRRAPFKNVPAAPAWFARDFQMITKATKTKPIHGASTRRQMIFKHAMATA